VSLVDQC